MLNVCSFTLADHHWPFRGGDIVATHSAAPAAHPRRPQHFDPRRDRHPRRAGLRAGRFPLCDGRRQEVHRPGSAGWRADRLPHRLRRRPPEWAQRPLLRSRGQPILHRPLDHSLESRIGGVYGYEWSTGTLTPIADGLAFPNGIVVYGGRLYMAETMTRKVWRFEILGPGRAGNRVEFCLLPEAADRRLAGRRRHGSGCGGESLRHPARGGMYSRLRPRGESPGEHPHHRPAPDERVLRRPRVRTRSTSRWMIWGHSSPSRWACRATAFLSAPPGAPTTRGRACCHQPLNRSSCSCPSSIPSSLAAAS